MAKFIDKKISIQQVGYQPRDKDISERMIERAKFIKNLEEPKKNKKNDK